MLLVFALNVQASRSRLCVELPRPILKLFVSISPPHAGSNSVEVVEFCRSNPHEFQTTSASPKRPNQPLSCYQSINGDVVLEIPNIFFNDCKDEEYFELMLDRYAYKWASLNSEPFSLVVYNKKHKFIQHGKYQDGDEVFQKVANWKLFVERAKFVNTRIVSGEYGPEEIMCSVSQLNADGEPCPDEVLRQFPIEVSVDQPTPILDRDLFRR